MKKLSGAIIVSMLLSACGEKHLHFVPATETNVEPESFEQILSESLVSDNVYEQLKDLYISAKGQPAVSDFDRKAPKTKKLCYRVDALNPMVLNQVVANRYTKYLPPIKDDEGIILPERTIEKILVGVRTELIHFDFWSEYLTNQNGQAVSVNVLNPGVPPKEQKRVSYYFKKDKKRIYFRAEGMDWNAKVDAYGVCYVPSVSGKDLE